MTETFLDAKTVLGNPKSSTWKYFKFRAAEDDIGALSTVFSAWWPEEKRGNKVLWWYHKSHKPPEILALDGVQVGD